jgi:hypothetical protein
MVPIRHRTAAAKWSHFGIDFEPFWGKNGAKTPKKGPKSGGYRYLSVNYAFLYSAHSLRLKRVLSLKK